MLVLLLLAVLMAGCVQPPVATQSSENTSPTTLTPPPSQPTESVPSVPTQPTQPKQYLLYSPYVVSDYARECMGEDYALYCAMVDAVIAYDGKVSGFEDEGQFLTVWGYLLREFAPAYEVLETAGTDPNPYTYQDGTVQLKFRLERDAHDKSIADFTDHINGVLSMVAQEDTPVQIVSKFYRYVSTQMDYDLGNMGHRLYRCILEGKGVCTHYAKYLQLLLNHAQIPCIEASGTGGVDHAWLMVQLDGKYYHFDPTFQNNFEAWFWFGIDDQLRKVSLLPEWGDMWMAGMDPSNLPTDAIVCYGPRNYYTYEFAPLPECPETYCADTRNTITEPWNWQ